MIYFASCPALDSTRFRSGAVTLPGGTHQTLTVVLHDELDKGTARAIYRQCLRFIAEPELKPYFYSE
jgi:hypothetical protein